MNFNVKTKASDSPKSQAVLFERCTVFANSKEQIEYIRKHIKKDGVIEVDGHEERSKSKKDNKYYSSVVVNKIVPIASGTEENAAPADDNLPF